MTYQAKCSRKAFLECGSACVHAVHMRWRAFVLCGSSRSTRTSTVSVGSRYAHDGYVAPTHPCSLDLRHYIRPSDIQ